jgi:hypothetical protein
MLLLPTETIVLILQLLVELPHQKYYSRNRVAALVTRLDDVRLVCRRFNAIVAENFPCFIRAGRQAILQSAAKSLCFYDVGAHDYARLVLLNITFSRRGLHAHTRVHTMTPGEYRDYIVACTLLRFANQNDVPLLTAVVDRLVFGDTGVTLPPRLPFEENSYFWPFRDGVSQQTMDQLLRIYPADALTFLTIRKNVSLACKFTYHVLLFLNTRSNGGNCHNRC